MTAATLPAEIEAAEMTDADALMHLRAVHERMAEADAARSCWWPMTRVEMRAVIHCVELDAVRREQERCIRSAVDKLTAMGLAVSAQTVAKHMREARS